MQHTGHSGPAQHRKQVRRRCVKAREAQLVRSIGGGMSRLPGRDRGIFVSGLDPASLLRTAGRASQSAAQSTASRVIGGGLHAASILIPAGTEPTLVGCAARTR